MRSVEGRIRDLLDEVEDLHQSNNGRSHQDRKFLAWRSRAEAAVAEKLGQDSRLAGQLSDLHFEYYGVYFEGMGPIDNAPYFRDDLNKAAGILEAALEAEPVRPEASAGPVVSINQVGPSANANASSTADVRINISANELRRLLAEDPRLTPGERGMAVAAVPDDDQDVTLEQVDTLLSIATKGRELLTGILGWLLANSDRVTGV